MSDKKDYISVSDIAKEFGMSKQGVHFYESQGLIEASFTTKAIRLYPKSTIKLIRKIKELSKSYKLKAIKKMIDEGKF